MDAYHMEPQILEACVATARALHAAHGWHCHVLDVILAEALLSGALIRLKRLRLVLLICWAFFACAIANESPPTFGEKLFCRGVLLLDLGGVAVGLRAAACIAFCASRSRALMYLIDRLGRLASSASRSSRFIRRIIFQ